MKREDRTVISKIFNVGPLFLANWLTCLSALRNRCAHHMRLYFHRIIAHPRFLKRELCFTQSNRIFDIIFIMQYLCLDSEKWIGFTISLLDLINEYKEDIDLQYIGFPKNWQDLLLSQKADKTS